MGVSQPDLLLVQYGGPTPGRTLSPPCAKARMALDFKGLEHRVVSCVGPHEVRRYDPRGRTPILVVDGRSIPDSFEILSYLDEHFPDPPLLPGDPAERARCLILEDWIDEVLYFAGSWTRWQDREGYERIRPILRGGLPFPLSRVAPWFGRRMILRRLAGQGTGRKPREVVLAELAEGMRRLEALVTHQPYLCGEQLSRADLSAAALVGQLCSSVTQPAARPRLEELPALRAWLRRVHERVPCRAEGWEPSEVED